MTDLDQLVERARGLSVRADAADAYVRELDRWARAAHPRPNRLAWLVPALAAAAAIAAFVLWPRARTPATTAAATPVQVGEHVAIVADPGTAYRVIAATQSETRIAVDHGAVTARLWHGLAPHRLALEGGGVIATATGTVYSLAVDAGGAVVHVDRGTVDVTDRIGTRAIAAGESSASGRAADPEGASALIALAGPAGESAPAPAPSPPPVVDAAVPDAMVVDAPAPAPPPITPPEPVKDRWRRERVLRGQGKLAEALVECIAIADARDATWSPIALVEAVRIELDPLAQPERAIELADRMLREYPDHALAPEARDLRCDALRQLGRGAECAAKP